MKNPRAYRQLWRVVDGAVRDALESHPDYLTRKGQASARMSITKRVTGAIMGYVEQSTRGRSGIAVPAAETGHGASHPPRPWKVLQGAFSRLWRGSARQGRTIHSQEPR